MQYVIAANRNSRARKLHTLKGTIYFGKDRWVSRKSYAQIFTDCNAACLERDRLQRITSFWDLEVQEVA